VEKKSEDSYFAKGCLELVALSILSIAAAGALAYVAHGCLAFSQSA
jgi:hypothetical protein